MNINDFAKIGTKVGQVIVTSHKDGYWAEIKKDGWDIACLTSRSQIRCWKSLDVMRKHLVKAGFRGEMVIEASSQISFL